MHKGFLIWASVFGILGVILGAFGAHKLYDLAKVYDLADPEKPFTTLLERAYKTGVTYQFYHALALIAVALLYVHIPGSLTQWAGRCFITGVILFSGSLYLITFVKFAKIDFPSIIGILTPIGGVFFIAGWVCLLLAVVKK
ncbi:MULTISPECIES: DUF423 domain-containing protein [unclassified Chitinophaga]|uniref:DUF423 domain-containing protein n=1 Tax=unclassified Chitinophaga TaxID=2619133 RepID=UPI0009C93516|nr:MULTISPECIES: DUF423 domain-containing protein [unclassified Chitinophaga]OMP77278.1 hypothetical protein BW716_20900 [[Flexibacter] sp. ATCC 35208]WPV66483.1 DUF423 domain-containing protein [Chitinophaga sp. LS1]